MALNRNVGIGSRMRRTPGGSLFGGGGASFGGPSPSGNYYEDVAAGLYSGGTYGDTGYGDPFGGGGQYNPYGSGSSSYTGPTYSPSPGINVPTSVDPRNWQDWYRAQPSYGEQGLGPGQAGYIGPYTGPSLAPPALPVEFAPPEQGGEAAPTLEGPVFYGSGGGDELLGGLPPNLPIDAILEQTALSPEVPAISPDFAAPEQGGFSAPASESPTRTSSGSRTSDPRQSAQADAERAAQALAGLTPDPEVGPLDRELFPPIEGLPEWAQPPNTIGEGMISLASQVPPIGFVKLAGNFLTNVLGGVPSTGRNFFEGRGNNQRPQSIPDSTPTFSAAPQPGGGGEQPPPAAPPGPTISRPDLARLPGRLQELLGGGLDELQQRAAIATGALFNSQPLYRAPEAEDYYGNLLARALINPGGEFGPMSRLLPVENQYLQQIRGLAGYGDDPGELLRGIGAIA